VTSELSEFTFDLRAVWVGEVRELFRQHVQSLDLVVQSDLPLHIEPIDEVVHRFRAIRRAVVDGMHRRATVPVGADIVVRLRTRCLGRQRK
jgi:hypothetical protein